MLISKIKTLRKAVSSIFRTEKAVKELQSSLVHRVSPVLFNDMHRIKPVSQDFGFSRGTPIDRYYIEKFLKRHGDCIHGSVLEVAEDTYTKKFGCSNCSRSVLLFQQGNAVNGGGVLPYSPVYADLTDHNSFKHDVFDCFISTQVFSFIYDVKAAVRGAWLLLKKGGALLATVSGIAQISRYDMVRWGDYWRFTDLSLKRLFGEVFGESNVVIEVFGNVLSATLALQGCAVEDLDDISVLDAKDMDYQVSLGIVATKR